jgi:N-acyl-D-amino-acid deacylase
MLLIALALAQPAPPGYVLRGATVYDGTGRPGVVADVVIAGDKLVADPPRGAVVIDAAGLVACPGFIDLHTHCDSGLQTRTGKANGNYVRQGCTTVVTGNCGSGPTDADKYFAALTAGGVGTNVAHLAPHNSVRQAVMGNADRPPTAEELAKMQELVARAMAAGTFGLSTGLIYTPGTYAKTEEIIALATVAGKAGGLYASHIRDEGGGLLTAIEEALRIGREGGCRVHVSHIKASGKAAWGRANDAVRLIEAAQTAGQKVTADQYPYTASSTALKATLVPTRWRTGTEAEYVARLKDPDTGPKVRADIERALKARDDGAAVQIARYGKRKEWQGRTLAAIATAEGRPAVDIVMEIETSGGAGVVNFGMSEEDVRVFMRRPWVATASDGSVHSPNDTVPHPRSYGTFPRKLGRYAVGDGVVSLEAAVRSGTGLPADILGLTDRGHLKPGQAADVLVFDPREYRDTATYDRPHQYPTGVRWVFVNGRPAVADGKYDSTVLAGKVLRHGAK